MIHYGVFLNHGAPIAQDFHLLLGFCRSHQNAIHVYFISFLIYVVRGGTPRVSCIFTFVSGSVAAADTLYIYIYIFDFICNFIFFELPSLHATLIFLSVFTFHFSRMYSLECIHHQHIRFKARTPSRVCLIPFLFHNKLGIPTVKTTPYLNPLLSWKPMNPFSRYNYFSGSEQHLSLFIFITRSCFFLFSNTLHLTRKQLTRNCKEL